MNIQNGNIIKMTTNILYVIKDQRTEKKKCLSLFLSKEKRVHENKDVANIIYMFKAHCTGVC